MMMPNEQLTATTTGSGIQILVKVVPGASREAVAGLLNGALKVRVASPPEKGRANKALITFLAKSLKIPSKQITLVKGETTTRKVVHIAGLSLDALGSRLGVPVIRAE